MDTNSCDSDKTCAMGSLTAVTLPSICGKTKITKPASKCDDNKTSEILYISSVISECGNDRIPVRLLHPGI